MSKRLSHSSKGLAHHMPHRTRLKFPEEHRGNVAAMENVRESIRRIPGVKHVHVNHRTGSVTVDHDHQDDMLEHISEAVEGVAGELLESLLEAEQIAIPGVGIAVALLGKGLFSLGKNVKGQPLSTDDAGLLIPLLLLGIGVWKAREQELWWSTPPAYIFFYWAYNEYMRYHPPHGSPSNHNKNGHGHGHEAPRLTSQ